MASHLRVASAAVLVIAASGVTIAGQSNAAMLAGTSRAVACAPASPSTAPSAAMKIRGGRDSRRTLFGLGEPVIISVGTAQSAKVGDEFFVRRVVGDRFTPLVEGQYPISVHTAGAVQIVDTQADVSIAVVTFACDGISEGDFLERFQPPVLPTAEPEKTPDYEHPGRLMLGDERRQMGGAGEFMVIDRGTEHGLRPGHQVTIFRSTVQGGPVSTIGTAMVYAVMSERSVVRIEKSVDAVYIGDLVAIHR
jgi:hypothetical protein